MIVPEFFERVPRIRLRDPLAAFLGAVGDGGLIEYCYLDAVKLAGHSCPTVAGAWGLARRALDALYGGDVPERGALRIELQDAADAGVTGVIASVLTLVTGATRETGFKGLAGQFDRRGLLAFGAGGLPLSMRVTRLDSGAAVDAAFSAQTVPADPQMAPLMRKCLAGAADEAERRRFGELWQARVERILIGHADDAAVFRVQPVEPPRYASPPCFAQDFPGYFGEG